MELFQFLCFGGLIVLTLVAAMLARDQGDHGRSNWIWIAILVIGGMASAAVLATGIG